MLKPRISELREQTSLTQAQLAVFVGVTTNTIQNWESGKSGVDQIVKFLKLCTVLDCELKDLVDEVSDSGVVDTKPGSFSLKDLKELRHRWESGEPDLPIVSTSAQTPSPSARGGIV